MGFGEFLGGIVEAVEGGAGDVVGAGVDIAQDAVGAVKNVAKAGAWAVSNIDDAAIGVAKYGGEMVKGAAWLAQHPGYWDDAAKQLVIDQFTDPVNIATNIGMLGLTIATGGAAAPAWAAKIGLGAKGAASIGTAAKTVDTVSDVARAGKSVAKVVDVAQETSRTGRFVQGAARVADKLDTWQQKPEMLQRAIHSRVTGKLSDISGGLVKQSDIGFVAGQRLSLANRAMGEVQDLGQVKQWAHRAIAGGDLAPTATAGNLARLNWRANRTANQVRGVRDFRENMQVAADVTQAVAHPERAAVELGEAVWHEYGDEAVQLAAKKAPGLIKKKMLKGDKDEVEEAVHDPYQQAVSPQIGLMDFRLDQTHATRTSKRRPGGPAQITRTTTNTTMPTQIGPENWYGPQGGYSAGRGFNRQQTALPPLEQPGSYEPRSRTVVGI